MVGSHGDGGRVAPLCPVSTHLPGLQHADELHGDLGEGRPLVGAVTPALPHQLVPGDRARAVSVRGAERVEKLLGEMGRSRWEAKARGRRLGVHRELAGSCQKPVRAPRSGRGDAGRSAHLHLIVTVAGLLHAVALGQLLVELSTRHPAVRSPPCRHRHVRLWWGMGCPHPLDPEPQGGPMR